MRKREALTAKVGRRVRELRKLAKLTQAALAQKADLNVKYLGEVENGHRDLRITTLAKLGKALGVEPWALFRFTEKQQAIDQVESCLAGRDDVVAGHVLRVLREILLLVDSAR